MRQLIFSRGQFSALRSIVDYSAIIRELCYRRDQLSRVISQLESFEAGSSVGKSRRGRKSMGAEERKKVSARMKKYWASRRKARGN